MTFSQTLKERIAPLNLLNHPFYQTWNMGELSNETLQHYAGQYFHHVSAFPRYISATHSICEDITKRKLLLENLWDEENRGTDHPELWMQFAEALGASREDVKKAVLAGETKQLIETFFSFCRNTYAEGLASLYAYEHQIPEIATVKIDGLKKFYGVESEQGLKFFTVHQEADVFHREACEKLLDQLSPEEQAKALHAAETTAKALWNFLSGVQSTYESCGCGAKH
ncbi:MAG: CADD family putative folate metabolism protein [Alphaproteobacteria bacterium]|nr:MAG: CADD family putative folate metabolism protein [Alphaproteobacteria bacterium]